MVCLFGKNRGGLKSVHNLRAFLWWSRELRAKGKSSLNPVWSVAQFSSHISDMFVPIGEIRQRLPAQEIHTSEDIAGEPTSQLHSTSEMNILKITDQDSGLNKILNKDSVCQPISLSLFHLKKLFFSKKKNKASDWFGVFFIPQRNTPLASWAPCALLQSCQTVGGRRGEQGVLIPLHPTQTSPADSSVPFKNSTSLMDVIDASTATVWAPSPRTMILPRYHRMLWEQLGNHPSSLLGWTLCPRAGEVHTQNIQPELEVFASFAVSGRLWAARWILQHGALQVLQPHSNAGKAQLPISGIQNSGGLQWISSAKPAQRSCETVLNQYKLRWYQFKCNSLGTNQSQSKIILC